MSAEESEEGRFHLVFRGYDPDEVDEVLRAARRTAAVMQARIHALEAKCRALEEVGEGGPAATATEAVKRQRLEKRLRDAERRVEATRERETAVLERIRRLEEVLDVCRQGVEDIFGEPFA